MLVKKYYKLWASITLIIFMMVSVLSLSNNKAYAFDPDQFTVSEITIGKTFDRNRNLIKSYVLIKGTYLQDAEVGIITDAHGYESLSNRTTNSSSILQFEFDQDIKISSLVIGTGEVSVAESEGMPALTGVDRKVKLNSNLNIKGTNLNKLQDLTGNNLEVKINNVAIEQDKISVKDNETAIITMDAGKTGMQQMVFTKTQKGSLMVSGVEKSAPDVNLKYTYEDQFLLIQDLDVSDDLEMFPNRGEKGDTVFFRATKLDNYDVFFVKSTDGTDPYTYQNQGQNPTYKADAEEDMDILTVQVPDIETGEYYVVLTNKVLKGQDPMEAVISEWIVRIDNSDPGSEPEIFTVIDGKNKSKIYSIQPAEGPDSGSPAVISGQFLGSINITDFTLYEDVNDNTIFSGDKETLIRTLSKGAGESIGKYKDTIDIKEVSRQITVIIGNKATFREGASFSRDLDRLPINVAQVTDASTDPQKDVVVETTTVLTDTDNNTYVFKERAVLKDGYKFIPSMLEPRIDSITPEKIEVIKEADNQYKLPEPRLIALHGQNFAIHRFEKEGQIITRYPVVKLGEIVLDKNNEKDLQFYVLDDDGNILDGSKGNETGSKIVALIPDDKRITSTSIGKTFVEVINPVRNSEESGLSHRVQDMVEFVVVPDTKKPIIEKVNPDVVTVDGGEEVVIEGSNFASDVKVFLDGEEISSIKRQQDGKKITFTAPPGREGETQLQVMNPEGGMATWPFTYVTTYTNPKITDFAPKKGNTGTLVIVTGENFLKPEPTASEESILKLIGTRVFLEGIEVNEYNINNVTKKITLQDYDPAAGAVDPILSIVDGALKAADYYNALIYDDGNGHFFTMMVNAKGEIIIADGAGLEYTFQVEFESDGSRKIVASRTGGGTYDVTINKASLSIADGGLNLQAKTLYKVENNVITGCRVKVLDINTIHFTVPKLEADGYYDVTVMNPDTKKDSKKDKEGFLYFTQPQSKPKITGINPDEGSVEGGYDMEISGSDFVDDGEKKTRVYINGIEVSAEDTFVNPAGTKVTVKVPAYPGDLREDKGTDRLTVPVVVVNPDGGSDSKEDGFTYVVPKSHPEITKIVPAKGSAAGGDVVEITGSDFRYYEPYDDANRNQLWDEGEEYNDFNGDGNWDIIDENDPEAEPMPLNHPQYSEYFNSPILPKVYFGNQLAKIVEFDRGYIKVITPSGTAGQVDVYIVNNDSGISDTVKFTYEGSSPKVDRIIPDEGNKQGRENVEIYGAGFFNSNVEIYRDDIVQTKQMPLVRFGEITNRDIPRDQPNSGRIDSGRTSVELPGGLRIEYRATGAMASLTVSIKENDTIYEASFDEYNDSVKFIDVESLLSTSDGITRYNGYELIRVKVEDRRLLVDRGYSPSVDLLRSTQMVVRTPSYYTVGKVTVTVENPDGGTADGEFEYKNPDSNPKITNITRDGRAPQETTVNGQSVRLVQMNYEGNSVVSIFGEDFRENARIFIGDFLTIEPKDINYTLPGKLTFTMPDVDESQVGKLQRVVVMNEDGGVAASDEMPAGQKSIYLQFTKGETAPEITKVEPLEGPAAGGTVVKIEGKDFRAGMTGYEGKSLVVYFGEQKASRVEVVDYKTIYVVTPANLPGNQPIRIENPDGEIAEPGDEFNFISNPKITAVVSASDPTENTRVREISITGGEEIKIKGSGFMEGARIIFAPITKKAENKDGADIYRVTSIVKDFAGSKLTSTELDFYILESGTEGTETKLIDSETLTVKVPPGKVETGGIIVVNPDKGASDIYDDLTYDLPEIDAPLGVTAEIVRDNYNDTDRYIKVNWDSVEGATEYEIYVIEDDEQEEFIGSTELTSFIYKDIKPRTDYRFIVTAVGDFGSSKPSAESNEVTTGRTVGAPDEDGGLNENTTMTRQGNTAYINIGLKDYESNNILIDLTRGDLAGAKEAVVSIPARVITDYHAPDIEIRGGNFGVKFNPAVFRINQVYDNSHRDDAGVRFKVGAFNGNPAVGNGNNLSAVFELQADFFTAQDSTDISYLAANMSLLIDYDVMKARMRRLSDISLSRYDEYRNIWENIGREYYIGGTSAQSINRMGRYAVIGSRR